MQFINEMEKLLSYHCNMYYQLYSKSEYKKDIKINVYFNDPLEGIEIPPWDLTFWNVDMIVQFQYKNITRHITCPINRSKFKNQEVFNFSDVEMVKYIFGKAAVTSVNFDDTILKYIKNN